MTKKKPASLLFYSYAPNTGMQYHETGQQASEAAEKALRVLNHNQITGPDVEEVTWGEVTRRATPSGLGPAYVIKNALRLAYEADHPQVVNGRMENGNGDLVRLDNIRDTDLLFHDLVLEIAVFWKHISGKIERFKGYNFRDVQAVLALLKERHNVTRGGEEGNMTFFTFDRRFKLQIAVQKKIGFGPELEIAKAKLYEAADQMSEGAKEAEGVNALLTAAFTLVGDGQLRVSEILRLRTIKIENALWNEGLEIVDAAIIVTSKKQQIRLYERNEVGSYLPIPLDIAAL